MDNDQFCLRARHLSRKCVYHLALNNVKDPRMQDSFDFGMDLVMALVRLFI